MRKFKAENKKINQYMIHAVEVDVIEQNNEYEIVEFERGRDSGLALFINSKVEDIYKMDTCDWKKFKKENENYIDQAKGCWMFFYNK